MASPPADDESAAPSPLEGIEITVDEVVAVMTPDERKAWDTAWLRCENVKLRQVISQLVEANR